MDNSMGALFRELYYIIGIFEAIEERFKITITDIEASEVKTFDDLVELVKKKEAENDSRLQ